MAVVQGVKEKVHLPIYDCLTIKPGQQWREVERNSVIKFFIDVQGKTKLETNLQSASLLPHYNTFEARAMRVVISDFSPEFPEEPAVTAEGDEVKPPTGAAQTGVSATVELGIDEAMEKLREAQDSEDGTTEFDYTQQEVTDKIVTLSGTGAPIPGIVVLSVGGLKAAF